MYCKKQTNTHTPHLPIRICVYTKSLLNTATEFLFNNFIHTHFESQTVLPHKDQLMKSVPIQMSKLSEVLAHHLWLGNVSFTGESVFLSKRKKQQGKLAPKSSGARHRKIWYEMDTKTERKKKIWIYPSSPKLRSSKCWQVAQLQASNISVLFEYSEKAHQVLHNAEELCCFYKHTHTQRTPSPCNRCLCLTQMCSLTCLTWPLLQLMNVLPQAFGGDGGGAAIANNDRHTKNKK